MIMKNESNITIAFINGSNFEQAKIDLIDFISQFDADLCGDNGREYTWDSALELGYKSSIEYIVHESKVQDINSLIKNAMDTVLDTYDSYDYADYNYLNMPDGNIVITFAHS